MGRIHYLYMNTMHSFSEAFGFGLPIGISVFLVLALWSVFWKGLALWHASRRGDIWWFIALLLINTVGILEIIYLFAFAKLSKEELFGGMMKENDTATDKSK